MRFSCKSRGILFVLAFAAAQQLQAQTLGDDEWQQLQNYCTDCHNLDDFSGGFAFDLLSPDTLHEEAEIWEKIIRKLRGGMMPPPGQPRPDKNSVLALTGSLEQTLDLLAQDNPAVGAPLLHRMNRTEYANAIRDLLGFEVNPADLMPAEDSSAGFDNIATVLGMSSALMQSYVTAAAKISRLAVGDLTTSAGIASFQPPSGVSQSSHIAGLPLGTRGGMAVDYVFPLDADYTFNIRRFGNNNFALAAIALDETIEVVIDGEPVGLIPADKPPRLTLPVNAGPHHIQIAFLHTQPEQEVDDLYSVHASSASIGGFDITGPLNVRGPGTTPGRDNVFICYPRESSEATTCARSILDNLAQRAWRGPVEESALDTLMEFYADGESLRGFETGVQYGLARILVDPRFVYRFESEPEHLQAGDTYALDDYELASRLSFFIWSSLPDAQLLQLAEQGALQNPDVVKAQVARMLQDEKASALVNNFAVQWLSLRALDAINPLTKQYDGTLRESMKTETLMLFDSILREERSITDLLDADYTFVDERLARHYGIPYIKGSRFRRIDITDENRRGLLGHASILTLTSAPNRTSPVKRGQWVLENILGTPPPPPPPGVETNLDETAQASELATTIRQRLEQHRADPGCASCHDVIDPIGFALENFDEIGIWRDTINNEPVNTKAILWDGTALQGPQSLREFLEENQQNFVMTVSEKLLTYALGRKVEYYDMPALREIVRQAADENYTLQALITGITASPIFRLRQKSATAENAVTDSELKAETQASFSAVAQD